ncbi:helix-turn-helix transcriptional regulator (plasmid) [Mycolicibacterium fortuitum]|nr:helix-turn-helix transcriptional regulator [Mycolicibacterium fortuitum]
MANETLTARLKLRAVRESLGVTQAELAGRMGLTQARVSAIERTDPIRLTVETLNSYADALGGNLVISIATEEVWSTEIWRGDSDICGEDG